MTGIEQKLPVVVDTREQKPYNFPGISETIMRKLDVGDYSLDGHADSFAVERKTLDDLATSLGTDRERFEDEIQRAQSLDEFAVVIEAERDRVYQYRGEDNCPLYYSNFHPNSLIATVEKWPRKYDTLSFEWAGDRRGGMEETLRLLDQWYLQEELNNPE